MRVTRFFLPALIGLFATATLAVAAVGHYVTHLTGDEEVPPPNVTIVTSGQGQATFILSEDGSALEYKLEAANLTTPIVQAHIHVGAPGVNGPVVVFLFPAGPEDVDPAGVDNNGRLSSGTITAQDLRGPLAGQPLSALVDALNSGNAYVNVHTTRYPGGEIRGQVD